jgi:hypothetical protein
MNRNVEKSLLDIDFATLTRGPFTPSPAAWEDQVLYFLMLPEPVTPDAGVQAVTKAVARFARDGTPADDQTVLALSQIIQQR